MKKEKDNHNYIKFKKDNRGITLIELIVVIAIMAVLMGISSMAYYKWIIKSRKALDRDAAEIIGKSYYMAMSEYPEIEDMMEYFRKKRKDITTTVSATVNGKTETYQVVMIVASEKTYFTGTESIYREKQFYETFNELCGLKMKDGANPNMMPRYKVKRQGDHPEDGVGGKHREYQDVDRWRIVVRVDNGQVEVWSADGTRWGGYPQYRVWPDCDDEYK